MLLTGLAAWAALTGNAVAQGGNRPYPYKPIRWVTGGGPDAMARILGQKITEAWGQQVVVEERGSGGGMMSAELILDACVRIPVIGSGVAPDAIDASERFAPAIEAVLRAVAQHLARPR